MAETEPLPAPFQFAESALSSRILLAAVVAAAAILLAALQGTRALRPSTPNVQQVARTRVPFRVPDVTELTDSVFKASALRGRAILLATPDSLPHNVGNALRCASCHLEGGLKQDAMPWVGSYARFPQYRARSGKVDLIEDRINDCFERSMNGKRLNPAGRDMRDIVAYFAFLSAGIPVGAEMEGQGIPRLAPLN